MRTLIARDHNRIGIEGTGRIHLGGLVQARTALPPRVALLPEGCMKGCKLQGACMKLSSGNDKM
jgi:hypothetical protein